MSTRALCDPLIAQPDADWGILLQRA